jgi:hypothetical protein
VTRYARAAERFLDLERAGADPEALDAAADAAGRAERTARLAMSLHRVPVVRVGSMTLVDTTQTAGDPDGVFGMNVAILRDPRT